MEYRTLGSTGLQVSEISMGCEGFLDMPEQQMTDMIHDLMDQGLNLIEMYAPNPEFHEKLGRAIAGHRQEIILQAHLCSVWKNSEYLRTREIGEVKQAWEERLQQLGTDYIDIGMLHFIDTTEDWENVLNGPVMEYAQELKKKGTIRHLGLSTHSAEAAMAAARTGLIEVILFSVNPCYDMQPAEAGIEALMDDAAYAGESHVQDAGRKAFYEYCEKAGIGIDVMKAYGGGDILSETLSPFGRAFTPVQCIHYALTRPAVASVCLGCKTKEEWDAALAYLDASEEEKDYSSVLAGGGRYSIQGHCMYCGHCAPCTVGIRIADTTKYLNLAIAEGKVPETVRDHYRLLPHHASECIGCGICEERCPFGVPVIENMKKAAELFGK